MASPRSGEAMMLSYPALSIVVLMAAGKVVTAVVNLDCEGCPCQR
nr:hypothetical protein [Pseudomonas syringae pv. actinidiae]